MRINSAKERELIQLRLHGGLEVFKSFLGHQILLPADRRQWPSVDFVKWANAFREI